MSSPFLKALALIVAATATGCTGTSSGSCNFPDADAGDFCVTYTGPSYTSGWVLANCSTASGVYSSKGCLEGPEGLCTFNQGLSTEYVESCPASGGPDGGSIDCNVSCTSAGGNFSGM